ncbi:NADH-cytochrome b5 reductase 1 [Galdieria sulphuraria]|nr:NADH-cytochrome b5 reductase 1 [Galdieria sulphuraria]
MFLTTAGTIFPRETGNRNFGISKLGCYKCHRRFSVVYEAGARSVSCKHNQKGQQLSHTQRSKRIGDWIIVQENEDIRSFAERFQVSPEALRVANGLETCQEELKQGEIIFVPYVNVQRKMELSRQLQLSLTKTQSVDLDRKYSVVSQASNASIPKGRLSLFPFISIVVIMASLLYFLSEYGTGSLAMISGLLRKRALGALSYPQQFLQLKKLKVEENEGMEWILCTLRQRRELVPGMTRYTFDLPSARRTLGLELGQRVEFEATLYEKEHAVMGSYLLCTERMQQGNFDVVIPTTADAAISGFDLSGNKDPQFAEALNALQIGDSIRMRPGAKMLYYRGPKSPVDTLSVVCGGVGVAPICSLLLDILSDVESAVTNVFLLVVNERPDEFIFLDELESLEKRFPRILRLACVWKKVEEENSWDDREKYHFIERAVASHCPVWKEGTMSLLCGSEKWLLPHALKSFRRLGYSEEVTVCL